MKTTSTRRPAFTLVEMLVVILIMSILVTLVTLGVTRAMRFASEVGTKTEMAQIEQALGVAALDLGRVPYIPSILYLWDTPGNAQSDIAAEGNANVKSFKQMSLRMLKQMFPNWTSATWPTSPLNATQAYVFILGGRGGNEGFHATSGDPWATGGKRKGPYFNFKQDRLNSSNYTFKDYWNNDTFLVVYSSQMVASGTTPNSGETLPGYPSRQSPKSNTLYMPKGYQIFSAGKDGKWGTSYPATGTAFNGLLTGDGEDDQCNFSESPLGKPIND